MRVVAFDPGPHTGIAAWYRGDEGSVPVTDSSQMDGTFQDIADTAAAWLDGRPAACVVEDFRIGGSRGREANFTIELIGAIRLLCHQLLVPFHLQPPGAHRFATKDKLEAAGFHPVGAHARSASGHLLTWLVNTGHVRGEELVVR